MTADLVYLVAGGSLLLAVVLPAMLDRWVVSAPMVLVAVGLVIGLTPLPDGLPLNPQENRSTIEHVTELTILVALMGVGLAIDRPLDLLRRRSWASWGATWRLLGVAMPLTIAGVAALGWALGAPLAAAVLLGAVLAPTDPVLASDVQVAGPQTGDHEVDEADELRFTLTSEAGLNDGLAFPFVYLAVLLSAHGATGSWWWQWVGFYLVAKVVVGVVAGIAVGWVLSSLAFRSRRPWLRVAERGESLLALAVLASAYGLGELVGGYGFLSVFAAAMTFRAAERSHDYHAAMHQVVERLERLLTLLLLLVLGIALSRGLLGAMDWRGVLIGVLAVGLVRPLAGLAALAPYAHRCQPQLDRGQRRAAAFFGVRGVGSIYYLAYAAGETEELAAGWLWSTVCFTVVLSVVVHGALAAPVLGRLDRRRRGADRV